MRTAEGRPRGVMGRVLVGTLLLACMLLHLPGAEAASRFSSRFDRYEGKSKSKSGSKSSGSKSSSSSKGSSSKSSSRKASAGGGDPELTYKSVGDPLFSLDGVMQATVEDEPYPHLLVEDFLSPEALAEINQDFPELLDAVAHVEEPELIKLNQIKGSFHNLLQQLGDPSGLRTALGKKFGLDLTKTHTRFSMRGISVDEDGHVHTDDYKKVVTVLLYLNEDWTEPGSGGHLRLLRTGKVGDVAKEVPSWGGRMLAFANTKPESRGWHGYTKYVGPRRAVQINWMTEMRKNKYVSLTELKAALKAHRANIAAGQPPSYMSKFKSSTYNEAKGRSGNDETEEEPEEEELLLGRRLALL